MYERNERLKERGGLISLIVLLGSVVVAFFAFTWGSRDATAAGADPELARNAALALAGAALCAVVGIGSLLQVIVLREPGRPVVSAFGGILGIVLIGAAIILGMFVYPNLISQV